MATNVNKLELEKNNFIRNLSQEQFDMVIINKYKKVFFDYFDGNIDDAELVKRIDKNLELVDIYKSGNGGKIDTNQYLYSGIVDVSLHYYNVATGFETCMNKMNLLASYFQLVASANERLIYLNDLIADVFFIHGNIDGSVADDMLKSKLNKIVIVAESMNAIVGEISKHEDVISDVEKGTKIGFCDEILIDDNIKEMFGRFSDSASEISSGFKVLVDNCVDDSTGAKLDILKGKLL